MLTSLLRNTPFNIIIRVANTIALVLPPRPWLLRQRLISSQHCESFQSTQRIGNFWACPGRGGGGVGVNIILIKPSPLASEVPPFLFKQLSDALEWLVKNYLNMLSIIHILDDFCFCPTSTLLPLRNSSVLGPYLVWGLEHPDCP